MKNYQGCFAKDFKEFLFVQDFVSFFVGVFFLVSRIICMAGLVSDDKGATTDHVGATPGIIGSHVMWVRSL